jgi:hypothetical protein
MDLFERPVLMTMSLLLMVLLTIMLLLLLLMMLMLLVMNVRELAPVLEFDAFERSDYDDALAKSEDSVPEFGDSER